MGKRDAVEWIKWLISFADLEIPALDARGLRREIRVMWDHVGDERMLGTKESLLATDPKEIRPGMVRAQEITRHILDWITGAVPGHLEFRPKYRVRHSRAEGAPRRFEIFSEPRWSTPSGEPLNLFQPGRYGKYGVAFSSQVANQDFYQTIGAFLLVYLPHLEPTSIFRCSECKRFEFTNRGKKELRCTRCLTKARVESWRKREREKHGKASW